MRRNQGDCDVQKTSVLCTVQSVRAITYARVSTDDQADSGAGLDAQWAAITAAITHRGWEVVAELVDEGRSGSTLNGRPALAQALGMLERREADALVVAKLDRLSRSVLDFASITELARRQRWAVVALDIDVDMTTPTGELTANVTSAVAQWERRIIGARTSDALQAMKTRGTRLGRPVTLPHHTRTRIATQRNNGHTLRAIADTLNTEQVPTARGGRWHASTVRGVLTSLDLDADAEQLRGQPPVEDN